MLDYFVQALLFQTLFLVVYDFVLKKETFFQWNRAYLLSTSLLAYIIPLIKIESISQTIPQEYVVLLPEVVLSPQATIQEEFIMANETFTIVPYIFWLGAVIASVFFLLKLFKVLQLIKLSKKSSKNNYTLVYIDGVSPFSFFNYIFLQQQLSDDIKQQIITHELVHVGQKHSLDLLFFELQRIAFWFNPFSYIYQNRIAELHEFIADSKSIKETTKAAYFQNLLNTSFGTHKISFINPFFKNSLIKKRIVMLNKQQSKQLFKFKYLLLLPLLAGMLLYSSCEKESPATLSKNEKRLTSLFFANPDGLELRESKTKKEGYFDMYMLGATPDGKEISYEDLSNEEKLEYDEINKKFSKFGDDFAKFQIFEDEQGKKSLKQTLDWSKRKERTLEDYSEEDEIPFAIINNGPVFPGCENVEDKKKCFEEKVKEFITKNFDTSLAQNLQLEEGKKRIYVQFTIDKNGIVSDVKARAPHIDLEDQTSEMIYKLPSMKPAEHNGKKVAVKYTLPISFEVE